MCFWYLRWGKRMHPVPAGWAVCRKNVRSLLFLRRIRWSRHAFQQFHPLGVGTSACSGWRWGILPNFSCRWQSGLPFRGWWECLFRWRRSRLCRLHEAGIPAFSYGRRHGCRSSRTVCLKGWSLQEVADWQVLAKQKIAFLTYKSLLLLVVGRKNTCFFWTTPSFLGGILENISVFWE